VYCPLKLVDLQPLVDLEHVLEGELEIVGVHELDAVPAADVVESEDRRQRIALPDDVEVLVEQQGVLAFLLAHRASCSLGADR